MKITHILFATTLLATPALAQQNVDPTPIPSGNTDLRDQSSIQNNDPYAGANVNRGGVNTDPDEYGRSNPVGLDSTIQRNDEQLGSADRDLSSGSTVIIQDQPSSTTVQTVDPSMSSTGTTTGVIVQEDEQLGAMPDDASDPTPIPRGNVELKDRSSIQTNDPQAGVYVNQNPSVSTGSDPTGIDSTHQQQSR